MNSEGALDPRKLTFSQAQGYEALPRPLKLEELSEEARTKLWSCLYHFVSTDSDSRLWGKWRVIMQALHLNFHELPLDEFDVSFRSFLFAYKEIFLFDKFHRVFDLLQEIMRHEECPQGFVKSVAIIFEQSRLAYIVDVRHPATIYPAATEEEGKAIRRATDELSTAGLASAVIHLRQASDCINKGDHSGAVRESIHAVESTARRVDPNARALEPALRTLEKAGALHPALKKALSSLYGYTSDEQGIRHALIDTPQPKVGPDEALFMLGACAAFSSYLVRKHRRRDS